MRTFYTLPIGREIDKLQNEIYSKLNNSNKLLGRLCSIPVAVLDVALDTSKISLYVIDHIALALINLVGAAFSKECTLKDALLYTEGTFRLAAIIPVRVAFVPVKIIFQIFAIIINPKKVQSINYENPTFRS